MSILNQENVIYQCVLVCESFRNRYASIGTNLNSSLLSLINRPLLDYTLNTLKISGIHEVHLFCSTASNEVRTFIKQKWSDREKCPMTITIHSSDSYLSLGDILRDIFTKAIIRSDFILMHGDTICNINVVDLIEEHKARKAKDKGTIMTLVMRLSMPNHRTRRKENESAIIVAADTNRLLFYDKIKLKQVNINMSIFQENKVRIHFDLQDSQISVCSALVAQLFADNFDYQTRDDFIHGILDHEEILNNSIYIKILEENSYAARVYNPASYDSVCRDMIQRWTFPVVPDIEDNYIYQRHHIYKQDSTNLTAGSKLERNVVLSQNSIIGSKVHLENCTLEANCMIGDGVRIEASYILNGSKIEEDCQLNACMIGKNVKVKKGTVIDKGCLIANDVTLGPDVKLTPYTFIESEPLKDGQTIDVTLVGNEGKGYKWLQLDDDESEEEESPPDYWEVESSESDEDTFSSSEDERSEENQFENFDDDIKLFYNEVIESLQRGIEDRINCENLILEVNSSKHAYNIPINDVISLVMRAIMIIITRSKGGDDSKSVSNKIETVLNHFLPLIKNYIKNQNSQKDCIIALEEFTLSTLNPSSITLLTKVMSILYEQEVIEEDIILSWHSSPSTVSSLISDVEYDLKDQISIRQQKSILAFIQWLQEAEEESDESE